MRILHILDHSIPLHSGYTFRTRSILEQQQRRGWDPVCLTGTKHTAEYVPEEVVDGFRFFRTPPVTGVAAQLPVLKYVRQMGALKQRIAELARRLQPDILHAHSPVLNALPALSVARSLSIPVVYEVRAFWEDAAADHGTSPEGGLRYRLTRALETHALRRADAVTTICEGLRNEMIARGLPSSKITVIPNAVDVERFAVRGAPDPEFARALGLIDKKVLGFIGSYYAYEGLPLLLEALPAIHRRYPEVRVLLVGGGPEEANLRRRAAELGLEDVVVFVGRVPHGEVTRYYDLVDIFVYPRYSMRLTELVTPLKPLEAMAQERLVVASNVGGHRELIRDGETGFLFRAGDAPSLAAKVCQLFAEPDRWAEWRNRARRFVETERNWPGSVARYAPIYESLRTAGKRTP